MKTWKLIFEILKTSDRLYGQEVNEDKNKIIQIRGKQKPKEISKFEVVNEVKYLGVKLVGKGRDIFREEKRRWLKKAQKHAAQLMVQIKRRYDKVTVGKAIWKQVIVTALLFGKAVVVAAKTIISKIQAIENRVYKYLLGVAGYATVGSYHPLLK